MLAALSPSDQEDDVMQAFHKKISGQWRASASCPFVAAQCSGVKPGWEASCWMNCGSIVVAEVLAPLAIRSLDTAS